MRKAATKGGTMSRSATGTGSRTEPAARSVPKNGAIALRRVSKGKRPHFYENQAVDELFAIVTALAAELSVAFDRMDTLERVLSESGTLTAGRIEAYLPSAAAAETRSQKREELIQRVFAVFEAYGAAGPR